MTKLLRSIIHLPCWGIRIISYIKYSHKVVNKDRKIYFFLGFNNSIFGILTKQSSSPTYNLRFLLTSLGYVRGHLNRSVLYKNHKIVSFKITYSCVQAHDSYTILAINQAYSKGLGIIWGVPSRSINLQEHEKEVGIICFAKRHSFVSWFLAIDNINIDLGLGSSTRI